ncbi:MAG TPA: acetate uptake transporter [Ktedonobacterales bacterium]
MRDIKIANPAPLGLSAFALTTFVLSAANAGFLPNKGDALAVVGLALFYGGLVQLLAGMWEFRGGNTFGATAFSSYGGFWLAFGTLLLPIFGGKAAVELVSGTALGYFLFGWAIFTGIMLVAAVRTTGATALVFALLFLTFLVLAIGAVSGNTTITRIGGYIGILTALAAWYDAMAGVLASVSDGKIALPVYPLAQA